MLPEMLASACMLALLAGYARAAHYPRPDKDSNAEMARWLVHVTDWGVLATIENAKPFSGVVSHSDGATDDPTGRIFFYLAPMGELPKNAEKDPHVSYTVTEEQLSTGCAEPEEPVCAKVTFMGQFLPVKEDEGKAYDAMVKRHPKMADWASDAPSHGFTLYELQIEQIHLLDNFGGMKSVSKDDYFGAQLEQGQGPEPMSGGTSSVPDEQGASVSGNISYAAVWGAAMAGSVCGVLVLGVAALGYKMYIEKAERRQYSIALTNADIK